MGAWGRGEDVTVREHRRLMWLVLVTGLALASLSGSALGAKPKPQPQQIVAEPGCFAGPKFRFACGGNGHPQPTLAMYINQIETGETTVAFHSYIQFVDFDSSCLGLGPIRHPTNGPPFQYVGMQQVTRSIHIDARTGRFAYHGMSNGNAGKVPMDFTGRFTSDTTAIASVALHYAGCAPQRNVKMYFLKNG
jgi:hypothetical protein